MIVDSSAIIAVLNDEPESVEFATLLEERAVLQISAATVLETSIVAGRRRQLVLDEFLQHGGFVIMPVDADQAQVARSAYVRFGKGSGSPARLNFGDCFSYALARTSGQPLLFKGDDFTHTDVLPAR